MTRIVICKCDCGNISHHRLGNLFRGSMARSCGCLASELTKKRSTKFYPVVKKLYNTWHNMVNRCHVKTDQSYKDYGGKGVVVCEEWKNDYQKFLDWSLKNGWSKDLQLDKDIKGNGLIYGPDTCTWVTPDENANNKSTTRRVEYNGGLYSVAQIGRMTGVSYGLLHKRIHVRGMAVVDAVNFQKYYNKRGAK